MSDYPEHDRLLKIKDESQAIGEFLDGCGYTLCEVVYHASFNGPGGLSTEPTSDDSHGHFRPVMKPTDRILADWFGIDLNALEREKRAMLEAIRK